MGNSDSKPTSNLTPESISILFAQKCAKQFSGIEIWSLKQIFNELADEESGIKYWKEETLTKILGIPDTAAAASKLIFKSASYLAAFPFVSTLAPAPLTLEGLVKAIAFYDGKYKGLLKEKYDIAKLLFVSFATIESSGNGNSKETDDQQDDDNNDDEDIVVYTLKDIEAWDEFDVVRKIEQVSDRTYIPAHQLYVLFAYLLSISDYRPHKSMAEYVLARQEDAKLDLKFKNAALCHLRTMRPEITSVSSLEGIEIGFTEFKLALASYPNILHPLGQLFDQLMFYNAQHEDNSKQDSELSEKPEEDQAEGVVQRPAEHVHKLFNPSIRAQLSTFLPTIKLDNMIKLYTGSDDGFSMRSYETRVFKWPAPTIVLITGKVLSSPNSASQRSFDESFPPAKIMNSSMDSSVASLASVASSQRPRQRVTFGVYLETPWRASSKECFANSKTTLFQLAPRVEVYHSVPAPDNYAYFTRPQPGPGGIGFGSPPPAARRRGSVSGPAQQSREIGNVSLTLDESLEYATFRHLGAGGSFRASNNHPELEYEHRFAIEELEVWGSGTEEDLAAQKEKWEWEEREAEYRRRVNLKSGNHAEERALLELAGLVGQNRTGGSV